jgi:hypothetical protein
MKSSRTVTARAKSPPSKWPAAASRRRSAFSRGSVSAAAEASKARADWANRPGARCRSAREPRAAERAHSRSVWARRNAARPGGGQALEGGGQLQGLLEAAEAVEQGAGLLEQDAGLLALDVRV